MSGAVAEPMVSGPASIDPELDAALHAAHPQIATVLDPTTMARRLDDALGRGGGRSPRIVSCRPGWFTYVPGEALRLRYELELDGAPDARVEYVNASMLERNGGAAAFARRHLDPPAMRLTDRDGRWFARPVAVLDDLRMAVSAFPIDAGLPTLVGCADPEVAGRVIAEALSRDVRGCRVSLGHYGRRHRCVLRYDVELGSSTSSVERTRVYGKVAADDRGAAAHAALADVRGSASSLRCPRPLAYAADLRLLLLEEMTGEPIVGRLLRAGSGDANTVAGDLEAAIAACARLLAALHATPAAGPRRNAADEVDRLRSEVAAIAAVAPAFGGRIAAALEAASAVLSSAPAMPLTFGHGDFGPSQVVFAGPSAGVLDFDTVCVAEPALDVGHFTANLRLLAEKARKGRGAIDPLCASFIGTYARAAGGSARDDELLVVRSAAYEVASLVRLSIHAWQKLKAARLDHVSTILEERTRCLPSTV